MPDYRKTKHKRPSKAEMEERLIVPLPPEELVEGILQVKPEEQRDETERERARQRSDNDE